MFLPGSWSEELQRRLDFLTSFVKIPLMSMRKSTYWTTLQIKSHILMYHFLFFSHIKQIACKGASAWLNFGLNRTAFNGTICVAWRRFLVEPFCHKSSAPRPRVGFWDMALTLKAHITFNEWEDPCPTVQMLFLCLGLKTSTEAGSGLDWTQDERDVRTGPCPVFCLNQGSFNFF